MIKFCIPDVWELSPLESLFVHIIGGDWGQDTDYKDPDYVEVFCIRGAEFKLWNRNRGSTASLRKIKSSSLATRSLQLGDILIEISGGGPDQPVGRTVLITDRTLDNFDRPVICTNFLRLARPSQFINSVYLNCYLQSFYLSGDVKDYQGGSNNLRNS
jgi:type I restriction enzyme S subunit